MTILEKFREADMFSDSYSIIRLLYQCSYDETKTDRQKVDLIKSYTIGFVKKYYDNYEEILEKWKPTCK